MRVSQQVSVQVTFPCKGSVTGITLVGRGVFIMGANVAICCGFRLWCLAGDIALVKHRLVVPLELVIVVKGLRTGRAVESFAWQALSAWISKSRRPPLGISSKNRSCIASTIFGWQIEFAQKSLH